jgi:hypothetical protein
MPFGKDHVDKMAALLLSAECAGKYVVVCWDHENLPGLARAIGVAGIPDKWPHDDFSKIWQIAPDSSRADIQQPPI